MNKIMPEEVYILTAELPNGEHYLRGFKTNPSDGYTQYILTDHPTIIKALENLERAEFLLSLVTPNVGTIFYKECMVQANRCEESFTGLQQIRFKNSVAVRKLNRALDDGVIYDE